MYSQNKSLNFGHYKPNDQALNKKIPGNPKYQHVKPAVNTGQTVRRQIDELKDKQKNCQYKKDEVFNRIKFSNFIELLVEAAKVKLKSVETDGNPVNGTNEDKDTKKTEKVLPNVIMGVGEIDLVNQKKKPSNPQKRIEKDYPYLLLDVREKEKFLQCHIKTAKHYPSALLARSIGYETEEMKVYKNSSLEVIILYDDDESIGARVATTLVQRGYDNVFLLTGGLKYCSEVFPRKPMCHLCTNEMPDPNINASPVVQLKNAVAEFTQEDLEIIEQYMGYPRNGHCAQNARIGSSHSRSEKASEFKHGNTPGLKPRAASLTYRRGSDGSVKSIEEARTKINKSEVDSRSKTAKRAPWK